MRMIPLCPRVRMIYYLVWLRSLVVWPSAIYKSISFDVVSHLCLTEMKGAMISTLVVYSFGRDFFGWAQMAV